MPQYKLTGVAAAAHAKSQALHAKALPCRKCHIPTHHKDRNGHAFCVPCKVDAMPKDPALKTWRVGQWREAEDEGCGPV